MIYDLATLTPAYKKPKKNAPDSINHEELLKVINQISNTIYALVPKKLSSFSYESIIYGELFAQLTGLSINYASENLQIRWKGPEQRFHSFQKLNFINGKKRTAISDQPTLSRFAQLIARQNISEKCINIMLWGQFLYVLKCNMFDSNLILIADYNNESCNSDPSKRFLLFQNRNG